MKKIILIVVAVLFSILSHAQNINVNLDYSDIIDVAVSPNASGDSARYDVDISYEIFRIDVEADTVIMDTATITYSYVDSVAIVDAAFAKVDKEQNILAGAERTLFLEPNVTADLVQVNQALVALTGDNYFTLAYDRVPIVEGYWKIVYLGTRYFFSVASNGIATQVDNNGVPVGGGATGRFRIRSNERIELTNFTVSAINRIYFSVKPGTRRYVSLEDNTEVTFLRNF